ncbi:hypothetical protein [Streptomyces sp. NPDC046759]|uniref:hypothetical protein n=1 Tax=Streptomyces sp. NPDC046759 TaxID=3155019 RepID=UPI0033C2DFA7
MPEATVTRLRRVSSTGSSRFHGVALVSARLYAAAALLALALLPGTLSAGRR